MIHLDLFSGIGGFSYAADQVWDDVEHIFVEWDEFCQQVLLKHWPESEIYGDIKEYKPTIKADLVTGGFPCQPFSQAGKRKGTDDDRYLWPEMYRVIQLAKPEWVIAENVGGLASWNNGMVLEQVCLDLEAEDYQVQPFIIPAVAVNAPHRRDRIWIIGHRTGDRRQRRGAEAKAEERFGKQKPESSRELSSRPQGQDSYATDTIGSDGRRESSERSTNERRSTSEARSESLQSKNRKTYSSNTKPSYTDWNKDWLEIAAQFCSVDDGLPVKLDGFELSKSKHRAEQLKAYGNAIVPQVAVEIMKAIGESYGK